MGKQSELTSTEKLLDIIRDGGSSVSSATPEPDPVVPGKRGEIGKILKITKSSLTSLKYWQARFTVGVDIGNDALRLVKTRISADGQRPLIDYKIIPIPRGITRGSQELSNLIGESLNAFCGSPDRVDIWTSMPAGNVEVRHIVIPKVPAKQLSNAVYWNAKKELQLDEKEQIFDYEVHDEINDQGILKLTATVYTAPRREVEEVKDIFNRAGWPLKGLTIIPFTIQNLIRMELIDAGEDAAAALFIGNDFSRIDIYVKGNLVFTRDIKAGIKSLIESLVEGYGEKTRVPAKDDLDAVAAPLDSGEARKIIENLYSEANSSGVINRLNDIGKGDVLPLIMPAMDRLTRQVQLTFEHYLSSAGQARIGRLFFSSVIGPYQHFMDYIEERVRVEVIPLAPPLVRTGKIEFEEAGLYERGAYTAAMGLALSSNEYTPNMIFTYRGKLEKKSTQKVNKIILSSFVITMVVFTAIFLYLGNTVAASRTSFKKMEMEFEKIGPPVGKEVITRQLNELQEKNGRVIAYGRRNLNLATVAELTALTPPSIGLLSLKLSLIDSAAGPQKIEATAAAFQGIIILEGIIADAGRTMDVVLTEYVLKLEASPLFSEATIEKSSLETAGRKNVLHFTIKMKLGQTPKGPAA